MHSSETGEELSTVVGIIRMRGAEFNQPPHSPFRQAKFGLSDSEIPRESVLRPVGMAKAAKSPDPTQYS